MWSDRERLMFLRNLYTREAPVIGAAKALVDYEQLMQGSVDYDREYRDALLSALIHAVNTAREGTYRDPAR